MSRKSPDRLDNELNYNPKEFFEDGFLTKPEFDLVKGFLDQTGCPVNLFKLSKINVGLSTAKKLLIKYKGDFPFIVKLDSWEQIEIEAKGDATLRMKLPPTSILELSFCRKLGSRGILCYRFAPSGRVHDPVSRFDIWAQGQPKKRLIPAIDKLFEVVLQKAHWRDGDAKVDEIQPPHLTYAKTKRAQTVLKSYEDYIKSKGRLFCPIGTIHGDLHTKNIIINDDSEIVLIDFASASENKPIVEDFARFEAYLPHTVVRYDQTKESGDYSFLTYTKVCERLYTSKQLILPRSNRPIPSAIHEVRSSFWRGCLSNTHKMNPIDVDNVYSVYLAYFMAKYMIKRIDAKGGIPEPGLTLAELSLTSLIDS